MKLLKGYNGLTYLAGSRVCVDCGRRVKFKLLPEIAMMMLNEYDVCWKCEPHEQADKLLQGRVVIKYWEMGK